MHIFNVKAAKWIGDPLGFVSLNLTYAAMNMSLALNKSLLMITALKVAFLGYLSTLSQW